MRTWYRWIVSITFPNFKQSKDLVPQNRQTRKSKQARIKLLKIYRSLVYVRSLRWTRLFPYIFLGCIVSSRTNAQLACFDSSRQKSNVDPRRDTTLMSASRLTHYFISNAGCLISQSSLGFEHFSFYMFLWRWITCQSLDNGQRRSPCQQETQEKYVSKLLLKNPTSFGDYQRIIAVPGVWPRLPRKRHFHRLFATSTSGEFSGLAGLF